MFDFRFLSRALAKFQHFDALGAGFAGGLQCFFFGGNGARENEQFANMLHRGSMEGIGQLQKERLARSTVVVENANFDQSVGAQGQIDFFVYRRGEAIGPDEYHGVKAMRLGALCSTFGGCKLDLGHGRIIVRHEEPESRQ